MEANKEVNTEIKHANLLWSLPPGNIHDIRYLYNVIAGIKRKGGRVDSNIRTFRYLKKMIDDYNIAKASKYGLSFKPKEVGIKVVEHAIAELELLKLVDKDNEQLTLTNDGEVVAGLIERRDSNGLKKVFSKLMLENFKVFEYFLKRVKETSNGSGIPIPFVTSEVFDRCDREPTKLAENYVNIVNKYCSHIITDVSKLYDMLAELQHIQKRTEKIKKLQTLIERFIVTEVFGPTIKSRRVYDFVRARTTFLELTNYAIFDFEGFPAEVTYLISDFEPIFASAKVVEYSRGKLYINYPAFDNIRDVFKRTISKVYDTYKDEFGYAKIADVRDAVCRELRLSDYLFDEYVKKLYLEEPHWLSFTYSGAGDKVTEKRLPIVLEKPMREVFTLVKVIERR
jgi:hypothetical protein